MFPQIDAAALAAKYGLKILAVLATVVMLYSVYHAIDKGGYDRATALYEARDAKDAIKAARLTGSAGSISKRDFVHDGFGGALSKFAEIP